MAEEKEEQTEAFGEERSPKYETLKAEEHKYGTNNFIEVARKKIDDAEFISLSKGYYTKSGNKRYKNGIGFPDEADMRTFLIEQLKSI